MKVLLLTRYGLQGASSRMRFYQFFPYMQSAEFEFSVSPLLDDSALMRKYRSGSYGPLGLLKAYARRFAMLWRRHHYDLLWIEKEALPWMPSWIERLMLRGVPYVLDFDDAIFHNYDQHPSQWVRRILGARIDRLMAGAQLVVVGNGYLAQRASVAGASEVALLPTVVDMVRYPANQNALLTEPPRIVWIGSPSTVQYLSLLAEPLAALAKQQRFRLRVIGGGLFSIPGVDVEILPWSDATEAAAIGECAVGIMPLMDTPWEQGKCAYKLIQYMACGLPTVASPVGANCEVVVEGETGFLAATVEAWTEKLDLLLSDEALRQRLGAAGRKRVEANYSLEQAGPRLISLLQQAGGH